MMDILLHVLGAAAMMGLAAYPLWHLVHAPVWYGVAAAVISAVWFFREAVQARHQDKYGRRWVWPTAWSRQKLHEALWPSVTAFLIATILAVAHG